MRVLIVHNRYRYAGGEDAVVRAESALLRGGGIDVLEHQAVNEPEGPFRVLGDARLLLDSAWSARMFEEMRSLCARFQPDVVHVHNFWMKLTPAVHEAAHQSGAAVVQTLHNFRLLCANALLTRDGKPCTDCIGRLPWRGALHGCYRDSRVASAAAVRMIAGARRRGVWDHAVDAFITPSECARARFVAAGMHPARLYVKPNFTEDPGAMAETPSAFNTILYAGRLSAEKGVDVLLRAWALLLRSGFRLVIAGDGPESAALRQLATSCQSPDKPIEFAGALPPSEVRALMARSRVVVAPSLVAETFGMTVIEAFASGRPAIVTDIGGQSEVVDHGTNGYRIPTGDPRDLAAAMEACMVCGAVVDRMGANARGAYLSRFTPARNLDRLVEVYREAIAHAHPASVRHAVADRLEAAPRKLSVLGTGVSPTSYDQMLRLCRAWIQQRRRWMEEGSSAAAPKARYAAVLAVHSVMAARFDRRLANILNSADMGTPDGMPLVWALRSLGVAGQTRVYGPNLMLALCEQAAQLGHRVFLYGGRGETLEALRENLLGRFPALQIAGMYAPPFRPLTAEEDAECVRRIHASNADLVFVGIGMPKQEQWMFDHRLLLPGVVMLGVGAAFDFHAGRVRQAPPWMQSAGLEWLFRLCMEPARLWKRYIVFNPLFVGLWILQRLGILGFPLPEDAAAVRGEAG
jgi:exopolysaccharide biosynthesis WecB/TagA/CpsF family protein